jgi:murein L,D-transpeptidase YcbB/YkuD
VPAFLEYVTVSADSSGRLRFHPDVYGHDEQEIFAHDDGRIAIRQEGLPVDASL